MLLMTGVCDLPTTTGLLLLLLALLPLVEVSTAGFLLEEEGEHVVVLVLVLDVDDVDDRVALRR